jgi:hypothetical protein
MAKSIASIVVGTTKKIYFGVHYSLGSRVREQCFLKLEVLIKWCLLQMIILHLPTLDSESREVQKYT